MRDGEQFRTWPVLEARYLEVWQLRPGQADLVVICPGGQFSPMHKLCAPNQSSLLHRQHDGQAEARVSNH